MSNPAALHYAGVLENFYLGLGRLDATGAAAELRRLHAENEELRERLAATQAPAVAHATAPQPEAQPSFDDWAADQADLMSESNAWARDRITGEFVYSTMRVAERAWKAATRRPSAQAEQADSQAQVQGSGQ